jgi:hypothetical protein
MINPIRLRGWGFALASALACAACAPSVTAELDTQPETEVRKVVVGRIEAGREEWERAARHYRRALIRYLEASETFDAVQYPPPKTMPEDAVLVSARFLDVDEGSEPARFFIGTGVGAPRLKARIELSLPGGGPLAAFEQNLTHADGDGYGAHWNQVYMEDVIDQFAADTAATIVEWTLGEELGGGRWWF